MHDITRCGTFMPELLPTSAPEMGFPGLAGQAQGFSIHPGDHEDLAGDTILHDRGDQVIGVKF